MKIRCRRDLFFSQFSLASAFASSRDVRPALQNVKAIVKGSQILLTATDGEIGARVEMEAAEGFVVEEEGEAILPARLLKKILAETKEDEVVFESEGTTLRVSGENFKFNLATCSPDDFPLVAPFAEESYHKISTKALGETIRRTTFATDSENTHYALGGVLFNFEADKIAAVATDGRRLAYQTAAAESVGGHLAENQTIFPPRTLKLIERALGYAEEALIVAGEGRAAIKVGPLVVSSVLMEGHFPNWRAILPDKSGKKRVDFIAGSLASAVRQADVVATEKKPGVFLNFEAGKVVVSAAGEEIGDSSVQIPIVYDDEEISLRFDSRFLNEFLSCVSADETVSFYFLADKPALFETADGYSYVVMPLT